MLLNLCFALQLHALQISFIFVLLCERSPAKPYLSKLKLTLTHTNIFGNRHYYFVLNTLPAVHFSGPSKNSRHLATTVVGDAPVASRKTHAREQDAARGHPCHPSPSRPLSESPWLQPRGKPPLLKVGSSVSFIA